VTTNAQPWTESESIPYKQNGWVGDQFIPYARKYKGVRDHRVYLCGICYAVKQCEESRMGGNPMTDLEQYLADLAAKETAPVVASAASRPNGHAKANSRVARRPKRDKRPAMTADQARSFDSFSVGSTLMAQRALSCACAPYVDLFTYNRWLAQKFQVRKGSECIRLPLVKNVEELDDGGEVVKSRRILGTSRLFCRCQVDEIKAVAA
jgi:hypothetical protein